MAHFTEADLDLTPEEVASFVKQKSLTSSSWTACVKHSALQMEFFGEDELVTIVPSQTLASPDSKLICIGVSPDANMRSLEYDTRQQVSEAAAASVG